MPQDSVHQTDILHRRPFGKFLSAKRQTTGMLMGEPGTALHLADELEEDVQISKLYFRMSLMGFLGIPKRLAGPGII